MIGRLEHPPCLEDAFVLPPADGGFETIEGAGRILLRYSGTESLLRVMVEGEDQARIDSIAAELAGIVRREIGSP